MPTLAPAAQFCVVYDAQTQKGIECTIDAPGKLSEAIEEFQKQRADAWRSARVSPPCHRTQTPVH
jgi:hypothetical protein